jgi:hypothetical protein
MTSDDLILKDSPNSIRFWQNFHEEFIRWVVYTPKSTVEEEAPIEDKWWVLLYWIPRIKKDLYTLLLQGGMTAVEHRLYDQLGIDPVYFRKEFLFFIKRLERMKRLNRASPHLGETI